ncbi:hypothetical protein [Falsiroseomonas sp.]|uniref:hypothetical protein n=1 Tax=Falsiroseomonas sp. TaxID=2870721 RepID=UPI0035667F98
MRRQPRGLVLGDQDLGNLVELAEHYTQHTVRGFFADLKKWQGITVGVLERVRQLGPNKEGARVPFTVCSVPR